MESAVVIGNKNLRDFFVCRGADEAVRILDFGAEKWRVSAGKKAGRTVYGADGDATAVPNVKRALELIIEGNRQRQKHNLPSLAVADELMAMAAVNANMSAVTKTHWLGLREAYGLQYTGENLAWGYENPFAGWYDEEGGLYAAGSRAGIGHYLNLVNPENEAARRYTACGFAVTCRPGEMLTACQEFATDFGPGNTPAGTRITLERAVSAEEYLNDFLRYAAG
ncbi:MAG: CAP domain-containing protein [Solobacterium sp.]|nr:CAP domain-containing protein [Solobacterium sp.]